MIDESRLEWEVTKEEEIIVPGGGGGGGPRVTKLSELENDVPFIAQNDIVDNLSSDDATKPLSAKQGKVLFQFVSDGKDLVAAAITDKGIPASGGDTFPILANKVRQIETDKTGDATAVAGDILAGKTAYAKGSKLTGTIPDRRTGNYVAYDMSISGTALRFHPMPGYYDGIQGAAVQVSDPNFIAANIAKGKSIFGLAGTFEGASGAVENVLKALPTGGVTHQSYGGGTRTITLPAAATVFLQLFQLTAGGAPWYTQGHVIWIKVGSTWQSFGSPFSLATMTQTSGNTFNNFVYEGYGMHLVIFG